VFFKRPERRAAARRSPQAILDSRSGLEKRARQELDGEVCSAGVGGRRPNGELSTRHRNATATRPPHLNPALLDLCCEPGIKENR
jgi:hypothetical protein